MERNNDEAVLIAELTKTAAEGDEASMGIILEKYRERVARIAEGWLEKFRLTHDYHAKEDITQDVLMDLSYAIRHDLEKQWEKHRNKK